MQALRCGHTLRSLSLWGTNCSEEALKELSFRAAHLTYISLQTPLFNSVSARGVVALLRAVPLLRDVRIRNFDFLCFDCDDEEIECFDVTAEDVVAMLEAVGDSDPTRCCQLRRECKAYLSQFEALRR
jgi:hypothetical protein